ncbi:hypothetical protein BDZ89DRAFT_1067385 [Hymenopellis radicata]|nr:hypothetical protein BDZ89DRAFT_1067385 [Hymenopellis radicata]
MSLPPNSSSFGHAQVQSQTVANTGPQLHGKPIVQGTELDEEIHLLGGPTFLSTYLIRPS